MTVFLLTVFAQLQGAETNLNPDLAEGKGQTLPCCQSGPGWLALASPARPRGLPIVGEWSNLENLDAVGRMLHPNKDVQNL